MEQKQFNILRKVLAILYNKKLLDDLILIGSWAFYFYRYYFRTALIGELRTRDVDFLVVRKPLASVDLNEELGSLGFIKDFTGTEGYIRLAHPDIFIEFLVPEKGSGHGKPLLLPQLGLNAQPVRFLDILTLKTIKIKRSKVTITLPHPACFALQKIIIHNRRSDKGKKLKDLDQIEIVLRLLEEKGKLPTLRRIFNKVNKSWQKRILNELTNLGKTRFKDYLSES